MSSHPEQQATERTETHLVVPPSKKYVPHHTSEIMYGCVYPFVGVVYSILFLIDWYDKKRSPSNNKHTRQSVATADNMDT